MKASDTHLLLLTCPAPQQVLREFGDAVARGRIHGTATIIYTATGHGGENAKIKSYWRRIEQDAQLAAVWTSGRADLTIQGKKPAVLLTDLDFEDEAVEKFVAERMLTKPKRGKKRIQDEWTPFWIAAVQLAKVDRLNAGFFPTQKALYERLHVMMGATLDEQTIKPLSAIIYQQALEPTASHLEKLVAETD